MSKEQILNQTYSYVDLFASEYGWSLEYILKLPRDVVLKLVETILARKKQEYTFMTKLIAVGVNFGFAGKIDKVDQLFSDKEAPVNEEQLMNDLKKMWIVMKKDPKDFDKAYKEGNLKF